MTFSPTANIRKIMKQKSSRRKMSDSVFAYLLLSPEIALILIFLAFPIVSSIIISFTGLDLTRPDKGVEFVGFANYVTAITDKNFLASLTRTVYLTGSSLILVIGMGLGFALVLSQKFPGQRILRGLIIIPWAVPAVISGVMWKWFYSAQYGALNGILLSVGLIDRYQAWLSEPFLALNLIVIANVWKQVPFSTYMCMAAYSAIPGDLFEAAEVDGASRFRSFWKITLPLIMPTLVILMVLSTAWSFYAFDLVYVITEGGPASATTILPYYAYLRVFKFLKFGEGAAIGYIITLVIFGLSYAYIRTLYREIEY